MAELNIEIVKRIESDEKKTEENSKAEKARENDMWEDGQMGNWCSKCTKYEMS